MTEPTPEQLAAVNEAQSPQEYIAAAQAAGLTGDAEAAAAAGAHPVEAPDFSAMLAQMKVDQQAQIDAMRASFDAQLAALAAGVPAPAVDPHVPVARNLSAGVRVFTDSYPTAARVGPLADANEDLAAAVADSEGGAAIPVPDAELVGRVITTLRRVITANPTLETGLLAHVADGAEDQFGL